MSDERAIRLHVGPWSMEFERWSGWVRNIRLGETEVVRAVYSTARAADWKTPPSFVRTSHIEQTDVSATATWEAEQDAAEIVWFGRVRADAQSVEIEIRGEIGEDWSTKRTGMCVLLPAELAGESIEVIHPGESVDRIDLSPAINPDSPCTDVAGLKWDAGDVQIRAEFQGELFEMEDQRNWTDVSYKVYCRPQRLPQPFDLSAGSEVFHQVRLTFSGTPAQVAPRPAGFASAEGDFLPVPKIGTIGEADREFDFFLDPNSEKPWSNATGLDVAEFKGFVDFNRNRELGSAQAVAFGGVPSVHARDDRSIMENSLGILHILESAQQIANSLPVFLGPIHLSREPDSEERYSDPISAAWLASALIQATAGKADHACFFFRRHWTERTLEIMRLFRGKSLRKLISNRPYELQGCEFADGSAMLVNLTPFLQIFQWRHQELELEGYQARIIGPNG